MVFTRVFYHFFVKNSICVIKNGFIFFLPKQTTDCRATVCTQARVKKQVNHYISNT
ncbi:hypothetical protein M23134_02653 [Microscilla marina ATCC 23134]|uniref:Uncharacterized protein n=1 Tax=Microscilla marina ATCC 23134 TaxID=313606 RepID=A1ZNU5_MICM2|nr:hypothetical protein M23134_02653 [Microscilla marina ATCC 23134]